MARRLTVLVAVCLLAGCGDPGGLSRQDNQEPTVQVGVGETVERASRWRPCRRRLCRPVVPPWRIPAPPRSCFPDPIPEEPL